MAEIRHLSKAPIREAVLDIRFPMGEDELLGRLRDLVDELDSFAQVTEMRPASAMLRFSFDAAPEGRVMQGEPRGFRCTTEDELWVAQFRLDGLTLSRMAPYQDWEELSDRGRAFAAALLEMVNPPRVDRLALRYINHFRLPHPAELDDYFTALPKYPRTLPQYMSNLLTRVTLHDPETDFSAHVTHSLLDDLDPERMGFLLDVDAFRTTEFPSSTEALWETFEDLRVFKNEIFFGLITDRNAEAHE